MGQCCGKCREREEEAGAGETRESLAASLVTSEEPQDVTAPTPPLDVTVPAPPQDDTAPAPPLDVTVPAPPQDDLPDAAPLPSPPMGDFLPYPILQDNKTIEYVLKSKVLVILKGLPGSGKSYISNKLKQMYRDAIVCSADFYFMKDGEYNFSVEGLKPAHEACQQNAKEASVSGAPVIIIDNTNLQVWNYKYYLKLSKSYNYTPLIIEPQTPWAKNTKLLAKKNAHGVPKEALDQRLKKYEPTLPLYYWWYLNEDDSTLILTMAQEWLKKSLQVQEFFEDFREFSNLSSVEGMMKYYVKNEGQGDYKVLHATACVTRKGKAENAKEYMAKKAVKDSLGKSFTLPIIGFVLTPRTFGVRLRLGEEALEVYGMDDNEAESEDTLSNTVSKVSQRTGQQSGKEGERVSIGDTSLRSGSCQSTLRTGESQVHQARFHPTAGRGSRAHLTLGCASQVHAKITGFDMMKVVSCEQNIVKDESSEQSSEILETFSIPGGQLRTYGDSIWVIYPEKEMHVSSLFSAVY